MECLQKLTVFLSKMYREVGFIVLSAKPRHISPALLQADCTSPFRAIFKEFPS